jgi:hypothetical protein
MMAFPLYRGIVIRQNDNGEEYEMAFGFNSEEEAKCYTCSSAFDESVTGALISTDVEQLHDTGIYYSLGFDVDVAAEYFETLKQKWESEEDDWDRILANYQES